MTLPSPGRERELARQRWLVARLHEGRDDGQGAAQWLQPTHRERGLAAYEVNAAGAADRALAALFPTVRAMLGDEPFANLARVLWVEQPPARGDLAEWGHDLPAFLEVDAALREWPYLADCARLDLAHALCAGAGDAEPDHESLALLGDTDPAHIGLVFAPGLAVLCSRYPVVSLWLAHRRDESGQAAQDPEAGPLATARAALAAGTSECTRVWRDGWRPVVDAIGWPEAAFTRALCEGRALDAALAEAGEAGEGFSFEAWLVQALRQGWLLGARRLG